MNNGPAGLVYVRCEKITIKDNIFCGTEGIGIGLTNLTDSWIENNTLFDNKDGILLGASPNNTINNNTASSNKGFGIVLRTYSQNNTILGNNASSNGDTGIMFNYSSYNNLTNNTLSKNKFGIWLRRSPYNILRGNVMDHNSIRNFLGNQSNAVEYWNNDIDTSNTINGGPYHYFYRLNDTIIEGLTTKRVTVAGCNNVTIRNINYSDGDSITLVFTNNSLVENCAVSNNYGCGFFLVWSHYNRLANNEASDGRRGFFLQASTHNNISSNFISNNFEYGIDLRYSSLNNRIYNNYFDNANNAYDDGTNFWNIGQIEGTNIIGGSWLGGNYWSDYDGNDTNGDGIGDTLTPYNCSGNISSGGDWLPLVMAEENPYTNLDVGVTSNITIANSTDLAAYLPPEYDGVDISDAVVLNVNVTDNTPGNSTDDAYTDITINVGEMNIATCKVFKSDLGFLPEVPDISTLPTVKPPGEPAFSRNVANNTVTVRLYVGDPLLGVVPPAGPSKTGDMNSDGQITFDDVIVLAKHIYFGDTVYDDPDVNSDGSVTFDDVILLAKHVYFGDPIYP